MSVLIKAPSLYPYSAFPPVNPRMHVNLIKKKLSRHEDLNQLSTPTPTDEPGRRHWDFLYDTFANGKCTYILCIGIRQYTYTKENVSSFQNIQTTGVKTELLRWDEVVSHDAMW